MHRGVRFGLDVLRALEHQVLEEVREAGAARLLVLRADVIPELQVHDRRRVILRQHHRQAVGQRRDVWYCSFGGRTAAASKAASTAITSNGAVSAVGEQARRA